MRSQTVLDVLLWCSVAFLSPVRVCLAELPDPPPPRSRQAIESILAETSKLQWASDRGPLYVVFVADKKDHGPHEHDYPLWQKRWQVLLSGSGSGPVNLFGAPPQASSNDGAGPVTVATSKGWPSDQQFALADVIVVFCYIDWDEPKLAQLQEFLNAGGGFVLVHSATWTRPRPSQKVAELTGCGGFTRYRHGLVELQIVAPDHPICLGLPEQIAFLDESYWPPTPKLRDSSVQILAVSREETGKNPSELQPQPMFWTYECGKGRVFGCVLGHYTWTFDDPYFRLLLLRGIAWSARRSPYRFDALATYGVAMRD